MFSVQGSGFRIQGSGFEVQGSGSRAEEERVSCARAREKEKGLRVEGGGWRAEEDQSSVQPSACFSLMRSRIQGAVRSSPSWCGVYVCEDRRRWSPNPSGKYSYERPRRVTVCGTMRSMCGIDAGCLVLLRTRHRSYLLLVPPPTANSAHTRQSRTDYGLELKVNFVATLQVVPSLLRGADLQRDGGRPADHLLDEIVVRVPPSV